MAAWAKVSTDYQELSWMKVHYHQLFDTAWNYSLHCLTSQNGSRWDQCSLRFLIKGWTNEYFKNFVDQPLYNYHQLRKMFWNAISRAHDKLQLVYSTDCIDFLEWMHSLNLKTHRRSSRSAEWYDTPSRCLRCIRTSLQSTDRSYAMQKSNTTSAGGLWDRL